MTKNLSSALARLAQPRTALFVCDIQEKFAPTIKNFSKLISQTNRLLEASKAFNLPVIVTEQYTKGLGHTFNDLDIAHAKKVVEKTVFSMIVPEVEEFLQQWTKNNSDGTDAGAASSNDDYNIILCGLETHVCVLQTALDLRRRNFNVFVPLDAVSSRSLADRNVAFKRMSAAGCVPTTVESALFELMHDAKHPQFKIVQKIIRQLPDDMDLDRV